MRLPLELVGEVIERLADSPLTLCACTLVCKSWLPVVLRVLFHDFELAVNNADEIHPGSIFPHHVSRLSMTGTHHPGPTDITKTILLFDRIYSLRFAVHNHTHILPLLPNAFPCLRELNLQVNPVGDARALHTFVSAFPGLETLSIWTVRVNILPEKGGHHLSDLPPPAHLHTLTCMFGHPRRVLFLEWLLAGPVTLKHLTLHEITSDELQSTHALLHALGPHLRTLDISFRHTCATPIRLLSANTRLHTLRLDTDCYTTTSRLDIASALIDSASPTLSCLTLFVTLYTQPDALGWNALDTLLVHRVPALKCLHCVHKPLPVVKTKGLQSTLELLMKMWMPQCMKGGGVGEVYVMCHEEARPPPAVHHRRVFS
ncbi:hypothetical protein BD779DRAFT_1487415 [Infundibulicybe gibba]|nr:hypothetical protein BD779DRAFT_1487415 [Infundibulicybe gibba]